MFWVKKYQPTDEDYQMMRAVQAVRMGMNAAAEDTLTAYIKWRIFGMSHFFAIVSSLLLWYVANWQGALWYFGIYFFFSIFWHGAAILMNLVTWLFLIGSFIYVVYFLPA